MARQRRKKLDKKRWTLGLARQLVVEAARFVEAVAHLAKIARAPPARCEPTQSAADVGQGLELLAHCVAQARLALEQRHEVETRLDENLIEDLRTSEEQEAEIQ